MTCVPADHARVEKTDRGAGDRTESGSVKELETKSARWQPCRRQGAIGRAVRCRHIGCDMVVLLTPLAMAASKAAPP